MATVQKGLAIANGWMLWRNVKGVAIDIAPVAAVGGVLR